MPRAWSDDDLRRAVPLARSWSELRRRLGLAGGGTTNRRLRRRCEELGLATDHLPGPGELPRTWTDEDLRAAVAAARSLNGVFRALGLSVGGSAWRRLQEHILRLDLDTSHWRASGTQPSRGGAVPPRPIDDGLLRRVLPEARSIGQVIDALGLTRSSSSYRRVRTRIEQLGLDTDHLVGLGWRRGRTAPVRPARPLAEILVRGAEFGGGTSRLRDRLVREGVLRRRCARCHVTDWNGEPAPLQLDHVNGDPRDNRLENLRLLCPNCHAQTPTYCGRNIGNLYSSGSSGGP